jgi:hypothetical protein
MVAAPWPLAIEPFRTRPGPPAVLLVALSRRFRGLEEGVVVICSFCWCRRRRSRRAKHLAHSGHSKGFSFVWERSCRFRCSSRANARSQVPQTCGLGLSVLGGGKDPAALELPLTEATGAGAGSVLKIETRAEGQRGTGMRAYHSLRYSSHRWSRRAEMTSRRAWRGIEVDTQLDRSACSTEVVAGRKSCL